MTISIHDARALISAFKKREPPFDDTVSRPSLGANQQSDVFVSYFSKLSHADKGVMSAALAEAVLAADSHDAHELLSVIIKIMLLGDTPFFQAQLQMFEAYFLDQSHLDAWRTSSDLAVGRGSWRFGLGLINILTLLSSELVESKIRELMDNSASSHFRESIPRSVKLMRRQGHFVER